MSLFKKIRTTLVGKARNPLDRSVFHSISLVAILAWIGLGADGLSSSCYGPEEAYLALGQHVYLSVFVALATMLTVFIISASYSQIIDLFPSGGGGYLVASKLLSPSAGMVSGCALMIDYVLTITISVASGTDALFSFLPLPWHAHKLAFSVFGVLVLMILNMRGVKESVVPLIPIFMLFLITHIFVIVYALVTHVANVPSFAQTLHTDLSRTHAELGTLGLFFLVMRSYSLGAGTYTGIEAVSNGLPILREPRVRTGKRTMRYMAVSLAFTVFGLLIAYLFFNVQPQSGKTLNAGLFEAISSGWKFGPQFVWVTLLTEALLLFVAAQTGFLGGPRVLASMALDRWFPTRFASLSDRLVTQNGILLMGGAAIITMVLTKASVRFLVVLYSINVFITFCLSQLGMVRHWWMNRRQVRGWVYRLFVNGIGLLLTGFILLSVVVLKFNEGGWMTIFVTLGLVAVAIGIKRHYWHTVQLLRRLNDLVQVASASIPKTELAPATPDFRAKTAVLLVNGFNGLGLHTLFNIIRFFGNEFHNFVFIQVGVLDAGNFKGSEEVTHLQGQIEKEVDRYVQFMRSQGYYAEGRTIIGTDVIGEIEKLAPAILVKFPTTVFFGGQLVFPRESIFTRWLHNYTVFTMQRRFYSQGIPFVILPIRV